MKIVVIGGTGLIGSKLIRRFEAHGHDAVAAAPNTGVDTVTGKGLANVLADAAVVVDVANSPSFEDAAVLDFFETSTGNLLEAEKQAGVGHHVALSIVGTDRLPENGYFRAKIAQERLIESSGVSFSVVHATQFFEFVPAIADAAYDGTSVRMPSASFQPIAGDDVADAVARAALADPSGGHVDVAGPDRLPMDEFFRRALAALGDERPVVTDPHAPYFGSEVRQDSLVPIGPAQLGRIHYAEWHRS